jgi:hypothetical protein
MIRHLAREGLSPSKIAKQLQPKCKLSQQAVNQVLRRAGLLSFTPLPPFKHGIERAEYAYRLFQEGEIGAIIGRLLEVTPSRAYQLVHQGRRSILRKEVLKAKGLYKTKRPKDRSNLGRPIDMGGPRDEWLTFYPSADPRIDVFTRGL